MAEVTQDVAAVQQMIATAAQAQSDGDVEGFVRLLSADAILMPQQMPAVLGLDAIRDFWTAVLEQVSLEASADVDEVAVSGDWAYVRVSYDNIVTSLADGSSQGERGKSIWIAARQQDDDGWKFRRVIWSHHRFDL